MWETENFLASNNGILFVKETFPNPLASHSLWWELAPPCTSLSGALLHKWALSHWIPFPVEPGIQLSQSPPTPSFYFSFPKIFLTPVSLSPLPLQSMLLNSNNIILEGAEGENKDQHMASTHHFTPETQMGFFLEWFYSVLPELFSTMCHFTTIWNHDAKIKLFPLISSLADFPLKANLEFEIEFQLARFEVLKFGWSKHIFLILGVCYLIPLWTGRFLSPTF